MTTRSTRRSTALTAPLLALVLLISLLAPAGARPAESLASVIVTATRSVDEAAQAVRAVAGEVATSLAPFNMLVADVPADRVAALTADPRTAEVDRDVPMRVAAADGEAVGATSPALDAMNVPAAHERGADGSGVGVVLVDTGIADHSELAGRVAAKIDFTTEQDGVDRHGHGTFMAGLVAGTTTGVAPDSHLVSVKVAGADGSTRLSQVLVGLLAADRARTGFNAPVVVLALAGPAGERPDPVMQALEMLWARGSTVVVAAGNEGDAPGSVTSPGVDPYVVTAGASDDQGTADVADDVVSDFSGRGPTPWGHDKPEVIAPGRSTVSLRVADSTIDRENPSARVGDAYFKGTGTSMSAALTAGAAAAVLSGNPTLTNDVVKGRLVDAAAPIDGGGLVDVAATLDSVAGSGNDHLAPLPAPTTTTLEDGRDAPNDRAAAARERQRRRAMSRIPELAGWSWSGNQWAVGVWQGYSWVGNQWAGNQWAGNQWAGNQWAGNQWAGNQWAGNQWAGNQWAGWSWAGASWT